MKYFRIIILIVIASFIFTGCRRSYAGDTPTTKSYLEELGYLLYENNNFQYEIRYPDIFTDEDKYDNGVVLSSGDAKLSVWAERNTGKITLEDSYNAALENFTDHLDVTLNKNKYSLYYKTDNFSGYYYVMNYNDTFYGFKFTFPDEKKDEFKAYIENVQKNFLVLDKSGAD